MKVALVTDTHAGVRNDLECLKEHQNRFWENEFFPELKKRGIDTIIHGGSIDFNLNINVDTNGNVDSEIIKQGVQVALSDNEILKQIATSSKFQDYDNKTKIRLNRSIERKG